MKIILLFFCSIFINNLCFSQAQVNWVKNYGRNYADVPYAVKPDNFGNVFVTGLFSLAATNKGQTPLIKYSVSGDSIWSRIFMGPDSANSAGTQLLIDDSLNIYISGRFLLKYSSSGNLLYSKFYNCSTQLMRLDSTHNFVYSGMSQNDTPGLILLKCNKQGDSLWKKIYTQFHVAAVSGLAIDKLNNIIVTGRYTPTAENDADFLTVKFDPEGNYIWHNTYHGGDSTQGYDSPCGVVLDSMNNVIVSGRSNAPNGGSNYFTVKYDPSGNVIWETRYPVGGSGSADMKIDKAGNIYVCGITNLSQYSTIKYNSSGVLQWIQSVPSIGFAPDNYLTLDSSGNVYMACNANLSGSGTGYQIVKYNKNGVLLWNVLYPVSGSRFYYSTNIAVDNIGNVFVTGRGQPGTGTGYDFVTIRIDQTTGIIQNLSETPKSYSLSQNFPNPFNPTTNINFSIPKSGFVSLKVYDALGKLVKELANDFMNSGNYSVTFDAPSYASGIYYYTLFSNSFSNTKRMVLLK